MYIIRSINIQLLLARRDFFSIFTSMNNIAIDEPIFSLDKFQLLLYWWTEAIYLILKLQLIWDYRTQKNERKYFVLSFNGLLNITNYYCKLYGKPTHLLEYWTENSYIQNNGQLEKSKEFNNSLREDKQFPLTSEEM